MYSFSNLEQVCCSMSSSNCCFLTCILISQEADQVVWYSHLFQNCPQFIVIHIVKGFGIVNKTEIDVFLELSCFFHNPADVGNLISKHHPPVRGTKAPWRSGWARAGKIQMGKNARSQNMSLKMVILQWRNSSDTTLTK